MRRVFVTAALAGTLAAAFGCGVRGKDPSNTITRRLEGEPRTLNPLLTNTDPESIVAALVSGTFSTTTRT